MLSGNSLDHLLITLGAMTAGVPVAPVSVAYSLQSHDHARIRAIAELIRPEAVFADDPDRFAAALVPSRSRAPDLIGSRLRRASRRSGCPVGQLPVRDN